MCLEFPGITFEFGIITHNFPLFWGLFEDFPIELRPRGGPGYIQLSPETSKIAEVQAAPMASGGQESMGV